MNTLKIGNSTISINKPKETNNKALYDLYILFNSLCKSKDSFYTDDEFDKVKENQDVIFIKNII